MVTIGWGRRSPLGTRSGRRPLADGSSEKCLRDSATDRSSSNSDAGQAQTQEELSAGRQYIGIDLSSEQLSIARRHVPDATFVVGDLTTIGFRPASFDGVVAFYVFNHVPKDEVRPSFARIFTWLRPGGWLMSSLLTTEAEDRVEEWLDVPMFFGGADPGAYEPWLHEAGFEIELSEVREEVDPRYGWTDSLWVIASKPKA